MGTKSTCIETICILFLFSGHIRGPLPAPTRRSVTIFGSDPSILVIGVCLGRSAASRSRPAGRAAKKPIKKRAQTQRKNKKKYAANCEFSFRRCESRQTNDTRPTFRGVISRMTESPKVGHMHFLKVSGGGCSMAAANA